METEEQLTATISNTEGPCTRVVVYGSNLVCLHVEEWVEAKRGSREVGSASTPLRLHEVRTLRHFQHAVDYIEDRGRRE